MVGSGWRSGSGGLNRTQTVKTLKHLENLFPESIAGSTVAAVKVIVS